MTQQGDGCPIVNNSLQCIDPKVPWQGTGQWTDDNGRFSDDPEGDQSDGGVIWVRRLAESHSLVLQAVSLLRGCNSRYVRTTAVHVSRPSEQSAGLCMYIHVCMFVRGRRASDQRSHDIVGSCFVRLYLSIFCLSHFVACGCLSRKLNPKYLSVVPALSAPVPSLPGRPGQLPEQRAYCCCSEATAAGAGRCTALVRPLTTRPSTSLLSWTRRIQCSQCISFDR